MSADQSSDAQSDTAGQARQSMPTGGFSDSGLESITGGGGSAGAGSAYATFQVPSNVYTEARPGAFRSASGNVYPIAGAYPAFSIPPTIKKYWWVAALVIGGIIAYFMFFKGKKGKKFKL